MHVFKRLMDTSDPRQFEPETLRPKLLIFNININIGTSAKVSGHSKRFLRYQDVAAMRHFCANAETVS